MTACDFHPAAAVDLNDIWDFVAEDSPDAADTLIGDILARIDGLIRFPHQGLRRADLTSRPLRFVAVHESQRPAIDLRTASHRFKV